MAVSMSFWFMQVLYAALIEATALPKGRERKEGLANQL